MQDEIDPINEIELIDKAKKDPEAFGQLYDRYVVRIYNYIYYRVSNTDDAEDLTAKVFFKALDNIGKYRHMGLPFSAWLYRIAHNQIANFHRDRSRVKEISIDDLVLSDAGTKPSPERATQMNEEQKALLNLMNTLSPQKRDLIVLKFVHRLSNAEIGKIFGKSEGAIKSLYHRTLLELRDLVERYDLS
jgi:RNA polymerase sigma-70 factor (ECF subfamily)